ncbi:4Fe-4S binding protein, partial [[Clostridium] scindens]
SMKEDLEGFLIPVINQDLCIECGKCRNVCGFKEKNINVLNNQKVYAIKRKDISKRMESQSGGAFSCIAEYFLR